MTDPDVPSAGSGTASDRRTVSVIMPVHNAADYLRTSVESVLGQTHRALELVIVDDGSRDGSWDLIRSYADADPRVRAIRHATNGGVAAARNSGIEAAGGRRIAFLDSDDWWHPRKLELQVAHMERTGARVSYAAYDRVADDGSLLSRVRPPEVVSYTDMLKSNFIGHLSGMYDRELGPARFLRVGHEDYVFWLEMVRRAGTAACVPFDGPLAWYRVHGGSVSSNKLKAARWQWRIYRDNEKLGIGRALFYMAHYALHALAKRH